MARTGPVSDAPLVLLTDVPNLWTSLGNIDITVPP
jgi:hypothetical protein